MACGEVGDCKDLYVRNVYILGQSFSILGTLRSVIILYCAMFFQKEFIQSSRKPAWYDTFLGHIFRGPRHFFLSTDGGEFSEGIGLHAKNKTNIHAYFKVLVKIYSSSMLIAEEGKKITKSLPTHFTGTYPTGDRDLGKAKACTIPVLILHIYKSNFHKVIKCLEREFFIRHLSAIAIAIRIESTGLKSPILVALWFWQLMDIKPIQKEQISSHHNPEQ